MLRIGLDVGSTTIKCAVLSDEGKVVYREYIRHCAKISYHAAQMLRRIGDRFQDDVTVALAGSAGMGLAQRFGLPFVQEVYAAQQTAIHFYPDTDAVIELGGEDAKIIFLSHGGVEARMNGSCAGGTGAFIDQMASLLETPIEALDRLAQCSTRVYSIASRCGVFAKSDIQPLINQGATKEDLAMSIFQAVVNQTIAGLAQGRKIQGNVLYLGGPLTYFSGLRKCFDDTLQTSGICPEDSLYYVCYGAAMTEGKLVRVSALAKALDEEKLRGEWAKLKPLFASEKEYRAYAMRHLQTGQIAHHEEADYRGAMRIGVDAGSTTVKCVAIDEAGAILMKDYRAGGGDPVKHVQAFLLALYAQYPYARISGAYATGYGENLIQNAFEMDGGIVETMAHFRAAKALCPEVDFIIDIGGQDIKCFRIADNTVDDIFLNEACSSGCGSFLQTLAATWDMDAERFAKEGLYAQSPVDLGSRCTVFMNSAVKQAQKDGATLQDISAGLSISVVKNALYKVIRASNAKELGKHIVVQGGTFLSDAVLRAFETEIGREVIRPSDAGLMGAYGAALFASGEQSRILSKEALKHFERRVETRHCKGCENHCLLTVNHFTGNRTFISGNRCEKMNGLAQTQNGFNLFEDKRRWLDAYQTVVHGNRGRIGIPRVLNMYELMPFWHTLFTTLGFEVILSDKSTHKTYLLGQDSIPSDTVCYPAKLVHGHIRHLLEKNVDAIFYPCMSYNLNEGKGDNHYNCPVVAYYPEVIKANMPQIRGKLICEYFGLHRPKDFTKRFFNAMHTRFDTLTYAEVKMAAQKAFHAYEEYMTAIRDTGMRYLAKSRAEGRPVIILAGRPYHMDDEISHFIDRLIAQMGATVITEEAVSMHIKHTKVDVLNQWTYHARLYAAAEFVARLNDPGINLVQLNSFGCGLDAITTDEVRRILSDHGRVYTLIKIDEISNLATIKIRLRSLFAALEGRQPHGSTRGIYQGYEAGSHDFDPKHAAGAL